MQGRLIGYPIENHLFQLDSESVASILQDLLDIQAAGPSKKPEGYPHFEAFLRGNFGNSLYNLYFEPYNKKIWNTDLSEVPLGWLDGKLPMPNLNQILLSNIIKHEESTMVHAMFYYPKENGSQFIVDRLAEGLNINTATPILTLLKTKEGWLLNNQSFDKVIYTGDVRMLERIFQEADPALATAAAAVRDLPSNGTSNLFCETDPTDISWLYLPDGDILAHRIIYTGTFAPSNNRGSKRMTCVVEFSGKHERAFMEEQVSKLPGNLNALDYNYEPNSYVVQQPDTRSKIYELQRLLEPQGFFLAGRFAEWEYHNMDKAIEASMAVASKLQG
jgi:protoporphyrinogen oxidase